MDHQLVFEYIDQFINNKRYMDKKEIMYRLGFPVTMDEFWPIFLEKRKENGIKLYLKDKNNQEFWFTLTDNIKRRVVFIEERAKKKSVIFEKYSDYDFKKSVLANALIDEAFFSSTIEGAVSSKERTQELIKNNITPENESEQLIINSYEALKFIMKNLQEPIDENMILTIYNSLTMNMLESDQMGKYRNNAGYVWHKDGTRVVFEPPHYTEVPSLMEDLIDFINNADIHPVIKSCIIHYYFFYIQPFSKTNGTIGRFVSYLYLLKNGHDFFRFFSLSSSLQEDSYNYYKSIQDVENCGSDLTFFIDFQTLMLVTAVNKVFDKFEKDIQQRSITLFLDQTGEVLSARQRTAVDYYINMNKDSIDILEYQELFDISYDTSRNDLNKLVDLGLFKKSRFRKQFLYKMLHYDELLNTIDKLQTTY
jgi:Fic family protein